MTRKEASDIKKQAETEYILLTRPGSIHLFFSKEANDETVLKAYCHALYIKWHIANSEKIPTKKRIDTFYSSFTSEIKSSPWTIDCRLASHLLIHHFRYDKSSLNDHISSITKKNI